MVLQVPQRNSEPYVRHVTVPTGSNAAHTRPEINNSVGISLNAFAETI